MTGNVSDTAYSAAPVPAIKYRERVFIDISQGPIPDNILPRHHADCQRDPPCSIRQSTISKPCPKSPARLRGVRPWSSVALTLPPALLSVAQRLLRFFSNRFQSP
jgi:hypothetical protein